MIRFHRINRVDLQAWLVKHAIAGGTTDYHVRVWREDASRQATVQAELLAYFQETLDDAKRRLRSGFEDELSPFIHPVLDPAANYPRALNRITLQGYLGETFAALAVEHWDIHGRDDWQVPALLFRFHEVEFQHLERINQRIRAGELHLPDAEGERRPGRTGDDAIAFVKDNANNIVHVLTLEAKCIAANRADTLTDAHQKLNDGPSVPDSVRELVELLNQYDSNEAQVWQEALVRYRASGGGGAARYDAVVYVCGERPQQRNRIGWMSPTTRNAAYTLTRPLVGLEYQIDTRIPA